MKPILGAFLALNVFWLMACDPAMRIRQVTPQAPSAAVQTVRIQVKEIHEFIGTKQYAPHVEISNMSNSRITVTRVELITKRAAFPNDPRQPGSYPVEVLPGKSAPLDVWFVLGDSVWHTLREPSELQVYYQSGLKEQSAQISLTGRP